MLAAACPRVIMIEEAAETMEAPVTAGCVPTLEHLILVGDHKQLRPQCGVKMLELKPWQLNVSMFERLVDNNLPYKMLKRQRRMIPEIRRLLGPIYKNDIKDHSTMHDPAVRPPVPGMAVNSFFYSHSWPDSFDDNMSAANTQEADMIVGFFEYLVANGLTLGQITILCFYNGQRKLILRKLRSNQRLKNIVNAVFKVLTVDSYQGEENDVVLLSLVRSNDQGKIGFIGAENRVCVALSRAKRGFYIFGNAELLACESKLWAKVINIMLADESVIEEDRNPASEPFSRVVWNIPLRCSKHGRTMYIEHIEDWNTINGGCLEVCGENKPCGHVCDLACHPFGHEKTTCYEPCEKILECGHKCARDCHDRCWCSICEKKSRLAIDEKLVGARAEPGSSESGGSNAQKWREFANGGVEKHDRQLMEKQRERFIAGYVSKQAKLANSPEAVKYVSADCVPTPPVEVFGPAPGPSASTMAVPVAASEAVAPFIASDVPLLPVAATHGTPAMLQAPPVIAPAVVRPPPAPKRKLKVSHHNRFQRSVAPSEPSITSASAPFQAAGASSITQGSTVPPPAGLPGPPGLQMPQTPLNRQQHGVFENLLDVQMGEYSDPWELVEEPKSTVSKAKENSDDYSLIEFD